MPFCKGDAGFVKESHNLVVIRAEFKKAAKMFFVISLFFFSPPDTPASPSGSDRKPRRFRLRSSRSGSKEESAAEREAPYSPKHCPVIEQEAPSVFKEQFVPPDLSIWDYFIAKVTPRILIMSR